ncbi:NADP-dependent oxidoreductase domain-containing protein [Kalaharituber pfeilii]|nr:NADP-dependent oxidoreductase domain-containing protein [Kalaharituber pfeilii]
MNRIHNMAKLTIDSKVKLASGYEMPRLGFGVYKTPADICPAVVTTALSVGYRHIDSATAYRNEGACAFAMQAAATKGVPDPSDPTGAKRIVIPRSEIFFTSKLPPKFRGYEKTRDSIQKTLERNPGLEGYMDLYLIHAPYGGKENRLGQWRAMRDAWKEGKIRSLGVSNYSIAHMEELREWIEAEEKAHGPGAGGVISVGQWEIHPWLPRHDIVTYCRQHNIIPQAYSPLLRGARFATPPSTEPPKGSEYLYELAKKYSATPAQVLIRWSLQMDLVPLPKSVTDARIKENADVYGFELTEEEVKKLDTGGYEPVGWDPVKDCHD